MMSDRIRGLLSRRPEFGIQVALPAETLEIDTALHHDYAFAQQTLALLTVTTTAGWKGNAAIRPEYALPRQIRGRAGLAQHASDQARTSQQAGAYGDLAVTGHAAAWNRCDRAQDRGIF